MEASLYHPMEQYDDDDDGEKADGITTTATTTMDIEQAMERLSMIESELEMIQSDTAYDRAKNILQGLQFTDTMIHGPVTNLSGGWNMRLSIAQALFITSYDLLLLDEVTNHLDLAGIEWLIQFIHQSNRTMILVSHDKFFLDAVCTDMIVMEHHTLTYHVGNYTMYEQQVHEKTTREGQIIDAAERQRTKAMEFIQKQQQQHQPVSKYKSLDPNKQRQAKMIREKKLDRIGNYREDGKRYKLQSLKTLDEKSVRLAQKVQIEVDEQPMIHLRFPNPIWSPSIGTQDTIIQLEHLSFQYNNNNNQDNNDNAKLPCRQILNDVTVQIQRGSKIALVGKNGCGKTTLMKLLARAGNQDADESSLILTLRSSDNNRDGTLWVHPTIRIGHVSQSSIEDMNVYAHMTVLDYAEQYLVSGRAAATIIHQASHNVRQYLGGFGLGGKHASQHIGQLSGGERMRLCFAKVLADQPHVLLLDESTNHCDMQLLESLAGALKNFTGAVLMVSHNQSFLSGFCNELWVLNDGHITVHHSDTLTFDEIFSQYRNSITKDMSHQSLSHQRQQKTKLAQRATTQRAGTKQNIALL
jgi:ATPase subunit of ABC transporter with duplicated ATPase domains